MVSRLIQKALILYVASSVVTSAWAQSLGKAGDVAIYTASNPTHNAASQIIELQLRWGKESQNAQWLRLDLAKEVGENVRFWMLVRSFPSSDRCLAEEQVLRYIFSDNDSNNLEYTYSPSNKTALPSHGYWPYLLPRAKDPREKESVFPRKIEILGHEFTLNSVGIEQPFGIPKSQSLNLPQNLALGAKYNTRDRGIARRFDKATVETTHYLPNDYPIRILAGQTTFNVPSKHVELVQSQSVFYSGDNPLTVAFPECLYRSNYLGPNPDYLDEPAVRTSFDLQKQLKNDPTIATNITIESVLKHFKSGFQQANYVLRPTRFQKGLESRPDVDMGTMKALRQNMWSWEVHLSTGAYQLRAEPNGPPSAIVYEGRTASSRDLALFNSGTGAQIPTNDQQAWLDMIYGMMRGAARTTGKDWGISIYGQFNVPEIYRALSYAYDLGSSYFLFWTGDRGHHVPYKEQLEYSRFIKDYAKHHPDRDLEQLKYSAEVMILFPPGYTLLSKEPMWWLAPLNYEKKNAFGLSIREVLARVAAEIERCYRQGIAYDLAWDIEDLDLSGYREIIKIAESGLITVKSQEQESVFNRPRWPERPAGPSPELSIAVSAEAGTAPLFLVAQATIKEFSSPVYFSPEHDENGVWQNKKVIWQLYGPGANEYTHLSSNYDHETGILPMELELPGVYRLRASIVDRAGRSTVRWKTITVE